MDGETLRLLAPLGVGGILAGVIFGLYRRDAQQWQEAWKGQSQMLLQVVKENTSAITSLAERLKENMATIAAISDRLERIERER